MFGRRSPRAASAETGSHKISLVLTSTRSGRTFQRTVSWAAVRLLVAAAVFAALVVILGAVGFAGWIQSSGKVRHLAAENDSLRVQFRRLGELEENLARMSELNEKMQRMLGVEPQPDGDPSGGPGGAAGSGSEDARGGSGEGSPFVGGSDASTPGSPAARPLRSSPGAE